MEFIAEINSNQLEKIILSEIWVESSGEAQYIQVPSGCLPQVCLTVYKALIYLLALITWTHKLKNLS